MAIPKILHQVWEGRTAPFPKDFKKFSETWKSCNPQWEYRLWNNEQMENLVSIKFPGFSEAYHAFPEGVQRWDAIRYMILYAEGGVYADLDSECLESLDPLLEGKSCCFGLEPPDHCLIFNVKELIGNAFMASNPNNPFLKHILEDLKLFQNIEISTVHYVMKTTGPLMLNRAYASYSKKEDIELLSHELVTPLTRDEVFQIIRIQANEIIEEKLEKAYAVHYFFNTWFNDGNGIKIPV